MTDRYTVFGNPIAHSKSPQIHQSFAAETAQDLVYDKTLIDLGKFDETVSEMQQAGLKGANVTVPFKEDAFRFATTLTERATRAEAVNTLIFNEDGSVVGDNTDGVGLVTDLLRQGVVLKDARILLLGAGGAAKGVMLPLLEHQPEVLVVANRTASKAVQLAMSFAADGQVIGCGYEALAEHTGNQTFDVVINATSASINGDVPPIPSAVVHQDTACYDMMYGDTETAFLAWASEHGCTLRIDGLGMLIGQAAEAFRVWRGVMPNVAPVIERMRAK